MLGTHCLDPLAQGVYIRAPTWAIIERVNHQRKKDERMLESVFLCIYQTSTEVLLILIYDFSFLIPADKIAIISINVFTAVYTAIS